MTDNQEWLTPEEVAARIKVSEETVRRWLRSGQLVGSLLSGRHWRVFVAELDAFMQRSRPRPGTDSRNQD